MSAKRRTGQFGERQAKILRFVEGFYDQNGYPPTVREIGEVTGVSSTSMVNYYLKQLEEAGFLRRDLRVSRGLQLMRPPGEQNLRVPVLGRIIAGKPITVPASDFSYMDCEHTLDVPGSLLARGRANRTLFALEVQGDSMIDALVHEGDYVVLRPADDAQNGDMVAAWLKKNEQTTLKYFYREEHSVRLEPANPAYKAIRIDKPDEVEVQGIVELVIRAVRGRP